MYVVGLIICLCVLAYFATWIDDVTGTHELAWTCFIGVIACLIWPLTLVLAAVAGPLYFLARLGAKRRGDIL